MQFEKQYPLNTKYDFHFIVLGVGGTGSILVPHLVRQLSFKKSDGLSTGTLTGASFKHSVVLCDKDKVEEKNLVRQNFYLPDLGKNKAEIMAFKCSAMFGMEVNAYPNYVENLDALQVLVNMGGNRVPFIVGCVDNTATRKMVHEFVDNYEAGPIFYLDAGNTEFNGQAVLGHKCGYKSLRYNGDDTVSFNLADVMFHYPEMMESTEKFASELSCAEAAVSDPQASDVNLESATVLYEFISNCLRGSIDYHKVTFNVLFGNRRVTFNTESTMRAMGVKGFKRPGQEVVTPQEVLPDPVEEVTTQDGATMPEVPTTDLEITF